MNPSAQQKWKFNPNLYKYVLWYQNEFALGDKIYLFFASIPLHLITYFLWDLSICRNIFRPCRLPLIHVLTWMNWWWIGDESHPTFTWLPCAAVLLSVTQHCLSSATLHLLMLLSSSNILLISVSLFLSWAFVPSAYFPLQLFYSPKSFLPSTQWLLIFLSCQSQLLFPPLCLVRPGSPTVFVLFKFCKSSPCPTLLKTKLWTRSCGMYGDLGVHPEPWRK